MSPRFAHALGGPVGLASMSALTGLPHALAGFPAACNQMALNPAGAMTQVLSMTSPPPPPPPSVAVAPPPGALMHQHHHHHHPHQQRHLQHCLPPSHSGAPAILGKPSKVLHFRGVPSETTEGEIIQLGQPFGKMTNLVLAKKKNQVGKYEVHLL